MSDTLPFQAEVQQLLELVVHSLYSDREIFLRELVSNASDALDRARFSALQRNDLREADGEPAITLTVDKDKGTITVSDNGIGLTREQAIEHLGTIARSGTKAFAQMLKERGASAEGLIGQFGVGFYASFMVAHRVQVQSLSAEPDAEPVYWESDGKGTFAVDTGTRTTRGTDVVLHLKAEAVEYLDEDRLREVISRHSDFVQYGVFLNDERINQSTALWARNPQEVAEEDYKEFYKHISSDYQDPLAWTHFRSEAPLEFSALLFFPQKRPFDLDQPDVKRGLRLYQRRVLVLEHAEAFLPRYLRFARGVVDAPEVSLNVSRELLQNTPVINAIRKQIVKRILRRLKEIGREDPATYRTFWDNFGATLKEGVAEDTDNKDALTPLLRFRTTETTDEEPWRDLAAIKGNLKEGQDAIWYITGQDLERMKASPQLERFRKKGWEVILLSDPVDEWVVMNLTEFDGTPLKSVARGDLDAGAEEDPIADEARKQAEPFATWLGGLLAGSVASVRPSKRLTDSPAVLVDSDWGVSANLERILRAARQEGPKAQRILEVNPEHALVKKLVSLHAEGKTDAAEPLARLLLDYAKIAEGQVDDAAGFSKRLSTLMEKAGQGL
ncbi:MAG: molecular chaperone HtpG [Pseudomonadota bacterium]|nr:molecular chaperone HtpG [Pseudomonadota bacterium]